MTTRQNRGPAASGIRRSTAGKREDWTITAGGQARRVVGSKKSAKVMDEAVEKYGRALRRLADR
jgi:hypothetical protein